MEFNNSQGECTRRINKVFIIRFSSENCCNGQKSNVNIDLIDSDVIFSSIGKMARERWKLFKNISKIGFQRTGETDVTTTIHIHTKFKFLERINAITFPLQCQTVYGGCKRKPSLYGSRHLTYEAPFPIDECHTDDIEIRRRPSRRERRPPFVRSLNRTLLRSNSLNVRAIKKSERLPVVRNASTPSTFQYANHSK